MSNRIGNWVVIAEVNYLTVARRYEDCTHLQAVWAFRKRYPIAKNVRVESSLHK